MLWLLWKHLECFYFPDLISYVQSGDQRCPVPVILETGELRDVT